MSDNSIQRPELAALADSGHRGNTVDSVCGVCPAGCGVRVHLRDGRIERLTPLSNHPLGIVCPRGGRAAEIVHSDDRLRYPQRRVGNRLERVGWDDAYEIWIDAMR